MPIRRAFLRIALSIGIGCAPIFAVAQEFSAPITTVLTIDQDVLFQSTLFGKRVNSTLKEERERLLVAKRQIESDLSAEELDLTKKRETLPPEEFRRLANAFDERVQAIRAAQDEKNRTFNRILTEERARFLKMIVPVIGEIMNERGALLVLNRRMAFISANSIDITQDAVRRIDILIGDGTISEDTTKPEQ